MATVLQLLRVLHRKKENKSVKEPLTLIPYIPTTLTPQEQFLKNCKIKESTCWEWLGQLDRYGYGRFQIGQKRIKAHRYSYEQHYGSFDKKLHVLHRCDNPRCVNPDHLFLGTNMDNVADRTTKKRGGDTSRRLTTEEKTKILVALKDGTATKALAEEFGVHISTIKRLKQTACKPI